MTDEFESVSMKNWLYFGGTIVLTTIVVAGLYGWIYGFNYLGKSVQGAGNVLTAAFNGQAPVAQQQWAPQQYTVQQPVYQAAPVQTQVAGQFVCPQHGAVGMPMYGQGGIPQCPVCGQVMQFISAGSAAVPAAWNTGNHQGQWGTGNAGAG